MANNFHDINGWLIVGIEGHNGFHIFPPAPMWFWKLTLLHPFTLGDKAQPTVLMNGVPSVTHNHEPTFLWPHLGIIPDPLDLMTPLHILFGSHKCWLPRGAVEICGEKSTCCVIGGPVSLNADCWEYGKWPTSLVLDPGTVQTTPTIGDFLMGALTLAIDLLIDLVFEVVMDLGGAALKKIGDDLIAPLFKKGDEAIEDGLRAATKNADDVAEEAGERAAKDAVDPNASALPNNKRCVDGHPVDLTSGAVVDEKTDLSLPGAIPLVWRRYYSSSRALERTSLGRGGWAHSFEQWVERVGDKTILRDDQGRDVYFPMLRPGERAFHRADRLTLEAREGGAFEVYSHATRLTRAFAPAEGGERALLRSIRDAYGNVITLDYTGDKLRRVIDTAGRDVRVKMTHGGRIARIEVWVGDSLEQWVDYTYAKMGELASATDCLGHAEHYGYDVDHRMVKATLKNGVSFYYAYDDETGWCKKTWGDDGLHTIEIAVDRERRITRTGGNEQPRIIHWNEAGLVLREETPDGIVLREHEYDKDQYLLSSANGAGETTRYEHDERGNKVREVDPAGNVTEWSYEDDLPVLRVGPDGLATRYEHDRSGLLRAVTYPSQLRYTMGYDERSHLCSIQIDGEVVASYVFDGSHNLVEEVNARGAKIVTSYDRLGRPIAQQDALGRIFGVDYDRLGRVVSNRRPDGTVTRSAYDPLGNPTRLTDELGQVTELEYAGTGILTKLTRPDGAAWRLQYTAREALRRIENPKGESYEFAYDSAGRLVKEVTFDGRALRYQYSAAGEVARVDYPDHTFRAFEHDPWGGMVREESSDGPITFERDVMGRAIKATVEQRGRSVVTVFERDRLGNLVAEIQDGRRIQYTLDARGRRTARVMPDGATTRYRYDALGDLVSLYHDGHEILFERDLARRETARRTRSGSFEIKSEYDSMNRIIEQRVDVPTPGGGVPKAIVQRLWQYDVAGRPKLVEDGRWGATSHRYDVLGQLVESARGSRRDVFAYDPAGSLQTLLDSLEPSPEGEPESCTIGGGGLLLRTPKARFEYDARGRRVSKLEGDDPAKPARTVYRWDCRDRLTSVLSPSGEQIVFTYDAYGRRVKKEVLDADGELRYSVDLLWDVDVVAADVDSRYGTRCFVHAPGSFVPLLQAERGEVFGYVNDHLGTPKELIDATGHLVWAASHEAWGELRDVQQTSSIGGRMVATPFRLLGHYEDEETGLSCTRHRYFDPSVGRWCSPDPLGIHGGLNLFSLDGAPTTTVDPLGLIDPFRLDQIPSKSGVYHVEAGGKVYTGSGVDIKDRVTQADHPARDLFDDPDAKISYYEVDLGTAATDADKNHMLRYHEQQVMNAKGNKPQSVDPNTNSRNRIRAASDKKLKKWEPDVDRFGASMGPETKVACGP